MKKKGMGQLVLWTRRTNGDGCIWHKAPQPFPGNWRRSTCTEKRKEAYRSGCQSLLTRPLSLNAGPRAATTHAHCSSRCWRCGDHTTPRLHELFASANSDRLQCSPYHNGLTYYRQNLCLVCQSLHESCSSPGRVMGFESHPNLCKIGYLA